MLFFHASLWKQPVQYILTEEEYNALKTKQKQWTDESKKTLQDVCTKVANEMPIKWGWGEPDDPKPWGCILTEKGEWYCDQCPVKKICPYEGKEWSK